MEELNRKLEKVLQQLDEAIEDIDVIKAKKAINDIHKLNGKSEGEKYDTILSKLEGAINSITGKIRDNEDLKVSEIIDLSNIRYEITTGKEPFVNIKKVVENLEEKGVNQEDLKQHKKAQKEDNSIQIEGLRRHNLDLATMISNIEMRYIEKIEENEERIKIVDEMAELKKKLEAFDPIKDKERYNEVSSNIKAKMSMLSSKGVDVSSIENFASNPNVLKSFDSVCSTIKSDLQIKSDDIAREITTDNSIRNDLKAQYNLNNISDAKDLKDKFKEMVGTRVKNSSKIATLEAENEQIDRTIETLNREEEIRDMLYDEDGDVKSEEEIAKIVLDKKSRGRQTGRYFDEDGNLRSDEELAKAVFNNSTYAKQIEDDVNNKFKGGFIDRFIARREFYKQTQGAGRVKSWFKAAFSKTNKVKMIVASTEAANKGKQIIQNAAQYGREMSDDAYYKIRARQNTFKETIKKEAVKAMSKNSSLSAKEVENDAMRKAYDKAAGEDNSR